MRRLIYLAAATRDLREILDYVAEVSGDAETGRRVVAGIERQCLKLAGLPGTLGRARPELRPDIRSFPFRNHVIFFRYREKAFEVVSIVERHRDVSSGLPSDDRET